MAAAGTSGERQVKRYGISVDEWYPVYDLGADSDGGRWIDLTGEEYADYKATCDAFEAWQGRLRRASEESRAVARAQQEQQARGRKP